MDYSVYFKIFNKKMQITINHDEQPSESIIKQVILNNLVIDKIELKKENETKPKFTQAELNDIENLQRILGMKK